MFVKDIFTKQSLHDLARVVGNLPHRRSSFIHTAVLLAIGYGYETTILYKLDVDQVPVRWYPKLLQVGVIEWRNQTRNF